MNFIILIHKTLFTMDFVKAKGEKRYILKLKDKQKRKAYKQTRDVHNNFPYLPNKKTYDESSSVMLNHCFRLGCSAYKKFHWHLTDKGINKGKTWGNSKHYNIHYAKQMIVVPDRQIDIKYKDNRTKEYVLDETKPVCVVCYTHNAGRGKFVYKLCSHGKQLCMTCAKICNRCPICRSVKC